VKCFFSKALDALGVQPEASYAALDPPLRDALVVGGRSRRSDLTRVPRDDRLAT
jgi:hypothetical protein